MRPPEIATIRRAVLRWSASHDRPLPWRGERDPYRVLVSEVMLQQTQASRIAAAYPEFLRTFPTVEALAGAEPAAVLRAWGTLGYNRRALNLWRAARVVAERGAFPATPDELQQLPGVGPYTARAVATFAFGLPVGIVEANVRRIFTRAFGAEVGDVQTLADRLVPRRDARRWNQALMDLGEAVCRARNPRCDECPLQVRCGWTKGPRRTSPVRPPAPRFVTTSRYARGRVVAELRGDRTWTTLTALRRRTGLSGPRLTSALRGLERDGLVSRRGARVYLGPASDEL